MALRDQKPALLLIDFQKGFDDLAHWGGQRNNPQAEAQAAIILERWRASQLPVFHAQHSSTEPNSPLRPDQPGFELRDELKPKAGEPLFVKNVNSPFIGTNLKEQLDEAGIHTLVIVGMTTNHCVSTTTRMAANLGYQTYLISDATATFDQVGIQGETYDAETVHLTSLASLKDEFATILRTEELLAAL